MSAEAIYKESKYKCYPVHIIQDFPWLVTSVFGKDREMLSQIWPVFYYLKFFLIQEICMAATLNPLHNVS